MLHCSVADPGGTKGAMPPPPGLLKNSHKKMVAERGSLYFMFLSPPLRNFWIHTIRPACTIRGFARFAKNVRCGGVGTGHRLVNTFPTASCEENVWYSGCRKLTLQCRGCGKNSKAVGCDQTVDSGAFFEEMEQAWTLWTGG